MWDSGRGPPAGGAQCSTEGPGLDRFPRLRPEQSPRSPARPPAASSRDLAAVRQARQHLDRRAAGGPRSRATPLSPLRRPSIARLSVSDHRQPSPRSKRSPRSGLLCLRAPVCPALVRLLDSRRQARGIERTRELRRRRAVLHFAGPRLVFAAANEYGRIPATAAAAAAFLYSGAQLPAADPRGPEARRRVRPRLAAPPADSASASFRRPARARSRRDRGAPGLTSDVEQRRVDPGRRSCGSCQGRGRRECEFEWVGQEGQGREQPAAAQAWLGLHPVQEAQARTLLPQSAWLERCCSPGLIVQRCDGVRPKCGTCDRLNHDCQYGGASGRLNRLRNCKLTRPCPQTRRKNALQRSTRS